MFRGGNGLLERADELDLLAGLIETAGGGRGGICLVEGSAGIGRTSMIQACAELSRRSGFGAVPASCAPQELELAWGVVRRLFNPLIGADAAERRGLLTGAAALAAPALGLGPDAGAGSLHGLYRLTAELAERRPLLIAVDDAQWADEESLRYLAHLTDRAADLPIVICLTTRAGESRRDPLTAIAARPETKVIALRELSEPSSAVLVRRALGEGATSRFCSACHAASAGNPFFLNELLAQLRRDRVEPFDGSAPEVTRTIPATVSRSVRLRLSRLRPEALELAAAVSVIGTEAEPGLAGRLAGLEPKLTGEAADSLAAVGVLRPGAPLEFIHPIVREAVYGELPPFERTRRHRRAAELLSRNAASADRVAAQLIRAEPTGDPWVVARLREAAAAESAGGAPGTAARLLDRARREPPPLDQRSAVLLELGRAQLAAGEPQALATLSEAAELGNDPRTLSETLLELGRVLYVAGRPLEGAAAFERALGELSRSGLDDRSLEAELRAAWLTVARMEVQLSSRAAGLVREIRARPPIGGSHGERALLAQVAGQLTLEGEPREECLRMARLALGDGELLRQETSDGMAWVAAMGALGWGDDFDAYEELQKEAISDARARGSVVGFATASYALSFSHYYRGKLSTAVTDAQRAIDAVSVGWSQFLPAARAQLAWALIEWGQLELAAVQLALAERDPGRERSSMQALVLEARARIELLRGRPRVALEAALEAGRVSTEGLISNPSVVPWRSRAALAAAQLGDRDRAEGLLQDALTLARRFGAPRPIGVALIAAGRVHGSAGIGELEEAVEVLGSSPARLEHCRALVMLGAALRRRGRREAARDVLRRGLEQSIACEARSLEQQARIELRASGARSVGRALSGVPSLTPAERRVAERARDGMTNREIAESLFLGLRTVETHLTHTYRKLGIDSRSQLAGALSGWEARPAGGSESGAGGVPLSEARVGGSPST